MSEINYNPETGLCRNACMSPCCEFFMKPTGELRKHLGNIIYLIQKVVGKISYQQDSIGLFLRDWIEVLRKYLTPQNLSIV